MISSKLKLQRATLVLARYQEYLVVTYGNVSCEPSQDHYLQR